MCPTQTPSLETSKRVTAEALTWLGTPWHHLARVKGAGVDCAQFLIAVFHAAGVLPLIDSGDYPEQWHLHRDEPRFLNLLSQYADPVGKPAPADIGMFHYGRHAAHGSIVLDDNRVIHAWRSAGQVVISDLETDKALATRLHGFYRLKALA